MKKNVMKIALAMIFSVAAIFYGGGVAVAAVMPRKFH